MITYLIFVVFCNREMVLFFAFRCLCSSAMSTVACPQLPYCFSKLIAVSPFSDTAVNACFHHQPDGLFGVFVGKGKDFQRWKIVTDTPGNIYTYMIITRIDTN